MTGLTIPTAVALVASIIERRNTIPILSYILVTSDGSTISFRATDLDNEVTATLPCKAPKFEAAVEGQLLKDVVALLGGVPGIRTDGNKLVVGEGPTFTLDTLPVEDFARLASFEADVSFELPAAQLQRDIEAVSPAISTEETRHYLMGINFETRDGKFSMAATDGQRLHIMERDAPKGAENLKQSIVRKKPLKAVQNAIAALPDVEAVRFSTKGLAARFDIGPVSIRTKLTDGTYPDVRRVVPTGILGKLTVSADELAACVSAARIMRRERCKPVKLEFRNGVVTAREPGGGQMTCAMPGEKFGELPESIGFNAALLAPICDLFSGKTMTMEVIDHAAPTLMKGEGSDLLCVLMPMRL